MCGNRSWLIRPGEINHLHTECADCVHGGRSLFLLLRHTLQRRAPYVKCKMMTMKGIENHLCKFVRTGRLPSK